MRWAICRVCKGFLELCTEKPHSFTSRPCQRYTPSTILAHRVVSTRSPCDFVSPMGSHDLNLLLRYTVLELLLYLMHTNILDFTNPRVFRPMSCTPGHVIHQTVYNSTSMNESRLLYWLDGGGRDARIGRYVSVVSFPYIGCIRMSVFKDIFGVRSSTS